MKEEYLSISEFAKRAGVSKAYIYKAIKDRHKVFEGIDINDERIERIGVRGI